MIYKTDDLSKFTFKPENRDIEPDNLNKIRASLRIRNLLELKPLLVNEKMQVIDGQHRLVAARELGLPVWYTIQKEENPEDIFLLQTQKTWSRVDYLKYYAHKGIEAAKLIYDDIKKYPNQAKRYSRLTHVLGMAGGATELISRLRSKKTPLPLSTKEMDTARALVAQTEGIIEGIQCAMVSRQAFLKGDGPFFAMVRILKKEGVTEELLVKKIQQRIDAIHQCSTREAYYDMFKSIYNYRNQNPIE